MKHQKFSPVWDADLKRKQEELIKRMLDNQVKVERNSFLEPFDSDAYHDRRMGFSIGSSKIVGSGRFMFGTGSKKH